MRVPITLPGGDGRFVLIKAKFEESPSELATVGRATHTDAVDGQDQGECCVQCA